MILARHVMTASPTCIPANQPVVEVVEHFLQNYMTSAPIVDDKGSVLGQVSDLVLMRVFVMSRVSDIKSPPIGNFKDLFLKPEFVEVDTPLPEVLTALIKCPLHRVLVREGGKNLVGIISPKDVLRFLSGGERDNLAKKFYEMEAKVADLNRNLQKAQTGIEQYKHLFTESPFMMHSVDQNGTITMANPKLCTFLGYYEKDLVGKTIFDIYPADLHPAIQKSLKEIAGGIQQTVAYTTFVTSSGRHERVEIISSSLKDDQGHFIGTMTLSQPMDGDKLLRELHGVLKPK